MKTILSLSALLITLTLTAQSNTATWFYNNTSGSGIQTYDATASGQSSIAMGRTTTASGYVSTAMGRTTTASGYVSTAMGLGTTASGEYSTAMGASTTASGNYSTTMGLQTTASDFNSLVVGKHNLLGSTVTNSATVFSLENTAFVIGNGTNSNNKSDALTVLFDGTTNVAGSVTATEFIGDGSQLTNLSVSSPFSLNDTSSNGIQSPTSEASGDFSTAMGVNTTASGNYSTAMGSGTNASGIVATAMGASTTAIGDNSTAMGGVTTASGNFSTTMGLQTTASDRSSLVIGEYNLLGSTVTNSATQFSTDNTAFVIGNGADANNKSDALTVLFDGTTNVAGTVTATEFIGDGSQLTNINYDNITFPIWRKGEEGGVEFGSSEASGYMAVAMGYDGVFASGWNSTAMGHSSGASGRISTAMGAHTRASGNTSTAMGQATTAIGDVSISMGDYTTASDYNSLVVGRYNLLGSTVTNSATEFSLENTAFVIGNGSGWDSSAQQTNRSDALTVLFDGTTNVAGSVTATEFIGDGSQLTNLSVSSPFSFNDTSGNGIQALGTIASGDSSTAMGWLTEATGDWSTAMGYLTTASGIHSTAMGVETTASADGSTAMGIGATASAGGSTAMGYFTEASGENSIAIGTGTTASGIFSTAMGIGATASGWTSAAMGFETTASDFNSLVVGQYNLLGSIVTNSATEFSLENTAFVIGNGADADNKSDALTVLFDGTTTIAGSVTATEFIGDGSQLTNLSVTSPFSLNDTSSNGIQSETNTASGNYSIAMGVETSASGDYSTSMGDSTTASGSSSTAMGYSTTASGDNSTAIGNGTTASGNSSTAMGYQTIASAPRAVAMGSGTLASGDSSTAMGIDTKASGGSSTATGSLTEASGTFSTAMGASTTASGDYSTTMGSQTTSSGFISTAMGAQTTSSGAGSTAMGDSTTASGSYSTSIGYKTTASDRSSLVVGQYNLLGSTVTNSATQFSTDNTAFVIGNGVNLDNRSDAFKVMFNGDTTVSNDLNVKGNVTVGDVSVLSDARLKANIISLGSTLAKLLQIDGKTYTMKKDENKKQKIGVLAQDIEKVFPELVSESKGVKSVNYQGLVPVLINALKEQQAEIDRLKTQEERLDRLERLVAAMD